MQNCFFWNCIHIPWGVPLEYCISEANWIMIVGNIFEIIWNTWSKCMHKWNKISNGYGVLNFFISLSYFGQHISQQWNTISTIAVFFLKQILEQVGARTSTEPDMQELTEQGPNSVPFHTPFIDWFWYYFTAAGVKQCGGCISSPRVSVIVHVYFFSILLGQGIYFVV